MSPCPKSTRHTVPALMALNSRKHIHRIITNAFPPPNNSHITVNDDDAAITTKIHPKPSTPKVINVFGPRVCRLNRDARRDESSLAHCFVYLARACCFCVGLLLLLFCVCSPSSRWTDRRPLGLTIFVFEKQSASRWLAARWTRLCFSWLIDEVD